MCHEQLKIWVNKAFSSNGALHASTVQAQMGIGQAAANKLARGECPWSGQLSVEETLKVFLFCRYAQIDPKEFADSYQITLHQKTMLILDNGGRTLAATRTWHVGKLQMYGELDDFYEDVLRRLGKTINPNLLTNFEVIADANQCIQGLTDASKQLTLAVGLVATPRRELNHLCLEPLKGLSWRLGVLHYGDATPNEFTWRSLLASNKVVRVMRGDVASDYLNGAGISRLKIETFEIANTVDYASAVAEALVRKGPGVYMSDLGTVARVSDKLIGKGQRLKQMTFDFRNGIPPSFPLCIAFRHAHDDRALVHRALSAVYNRCTLQLAQHYAKLGQHALPGLRLDYFTLSTDHTTRYFWASMLYEMLLQNCDAVSIANWIPSEALELLDPDAHLKGIDTLLGHAAKADIVAKLAEKLSGNTQSTSDKGLVHL